MKIRTVFTLFDLSYHTDFLRVTFTTQREYGSKPRVPLHSVGTSHRQRHEFDGTFYVCEDAADLSKALA